MTERIKLKDVQLNKILPLSQWEHPLIKEILSFLYASHDEMANYLGVILNALFCENKSTFVMSYSSFSQLLVEDPDFNLKKFDLNC